MPGPKPLPTNVKVLRGTLKKYRTTPNEAQPGGVARKPDDLSPEVSAAWDEMSAHLEGAGLLTSVDAQAFRTLCECWARYLHAQQQVRAYGAIIKSPSGAPMFSPFWMQLKSEEKSLGKLFAEFGMTPASRTRVSSSKPKENDNPWDDL